MLEICVLLQVVNTSTRDTLEMDPHLRGEDKEWSERLHQGRSVYSRPRELYLWWANFSTRCGLDESLQENVSKVELWPLCLSMVNQIKTSHDKCYENKFLIVQFNANYNCIDLTFQLVIERNYKSETVISARSDYLAT